MRFSRKLIIPAAVMSLLVALPAPALAHGRSMHQEHEEGEHQHEFEMQRPHRRDADRHAGLEVAFHKNPFRRPDLILQGEARPRLKWHRDRAAFPGDTPGSLTALYDATLPAGRMGFLLSRPLTQDDPFTAAAVFVIDPAGFEADPDGFFQISWGLWNSSTTGLERTGNAASFATNTFELLEFDYFPNISSFGGPFLSPSLAGVADLQDPLFDFLGAFSNFTFASAQVALPLGTPLLALMEHRPADGVVNISVLRVLSRRHLEPLPAASVTIPLLDLAPREYLLDSAGLTLWHDGFSGAVPSLRARVTYHNLVIRPSFEARRWRFLPHP